jgi:ABC-type uncharacterized transport system substrate-binding protein
MNAELGTKRLGLLHELLPIAVRFAVLLNPNNRNTDALTRDAQATASAIGKEVQVLLVRERCRQLVGCLNQVSGSDNGRPHSDGQD